MVLVSQTELRVVRLQARDVQVDVVMPGLVRGDVGQLPPVMLMRALFKIRAMWRRWRAETLLCVHGATQTKSLQALGLPEVVDVLDVVGEQTVKVVLRRESEWYGGVGGQEAKRRGRVQECGERWSRRVGGWCRGGSW